MSKMLITGGTVFVSRYAAEYFRDTYEVYVLNRNTREQCEGVTLIQGDRHALGNLLKGQYFDVILDITAYNAEDVEDLLTALDRFGTYVLVSSSAVYPETAMQPYREEEAIGPNCIWGNYGTDKIAAEAALLSRVKNAYILRPPYLYGPGNNVYREAFVFECALADRKFYLPENGAMQLQFFHVEDLCRFIARILEEKPEQRIFNVGNRESISIRDWVSLCYGCLGKKTEFVQVDPSIDQRAYFPFYRYEYRLDVQKQYGLMNDTKPLETGLREALDWYQAHKADVRRKPLIEYIDANFKEGNT